MLILSADDVRRALPMAEAVEAMKHAFAALSAGRAVVPQRARLPLARGAGVTLVMPSFVDDDDPGGRALAVKVVSLFEGNPARGLARVQAAVLAFEPDTGRPVALIEGAALTAIRTAAASGAATDLLARPDSRVAAVFGAGVQARAHVAAVCAVRRVETVRIYSRDRAHAAALVRELSAAPGFTARLVAAASPREALRGADVVCAATTSAVPVFEDDDLMPGAHVNAIGSYTPGAREVPPETVRRAVVVVDSREAAWEEAGDLIQPLEAGLIDRSHVRAELGELVLGRVAGRSDDREVTLFKSVGVAVQDAEAARRALGNARRMGLGTEVAF